MASKKRKVYEVLVSHHCSCYVNIEANSLKKARQIVDNQDFDIEDLYGHETVELFSVDGELLKEFEGVAYLSGISKPSTQEQKETVAIHNDEILEWLQNCPTHKWELIHYDDSGIQVMVNFNNQPYDFSERWNFPSDEGDDNI